MCISIQVKAGAENMISMYRGHSSRDKKLMAEAQQMLSDAKTKMEIIRMQILKAQQRGTEGVPETERKWSVTWFPQVQEIRKSPRSPPQYPQARKSLGFSEYLY